jgi:hypothetical protein
MLDTAESSLMTSPRAITDSGTLTKMIGLLGMAPEAALESKPDLVEFQSVIVVIFAHAEHVAARPGYGCKQLQLLQRRGHFRPPVEMEGSGEHRWQGRQCRKFLV